MQELDRVLDRHDVLPGGGVDLVDHRGERGGFAGAGHSRDEHAAALFERELLEHRRQAELVERRDLGRNDPEDGSELAFAAQDVHAEAAEALDVIGGVVLLELEQVHVVEHVIRGQDVRDQDGHALLGQGLELDLLHDPVDPQDRLGIGFQVHVGSAGFHGGGQELVEYAGVHVRPHFSGPDFESRQPIDPSVRPV